ncbi:MAG: ABC transporter permease [Rhodoferax sp.]
MGLPRLSFLACAAAVLAFLGAMLVAPVLRLWLYAWDQGADSLAGEGWLAPLWDPYLRGKLLWSLAQAGATALLSAVLGTMLAWVLARWRFRGSVWVARTLTLPFVVPTLVAALGVLAVWGPHGWLSPPGSTGMGAAWLLLYGNLFFNLGVVVRPAMEALGQVPASMLCAARTLGASPWRVFWRVEWPMVRAAVAAAAALVFLYCFTGLGLALVLGGHEWGTLEVEIYVLVAHELQLGAASILAAWVMVVGTVVAGLYAWLAQRSRAPLKVQPLEPQRPQGVRAWLLVAISLGVFGCFVLLPIVAIVFVAMNSIASWGLLWNEETALALANTLRFAAVTLVGACVLGVAHGWAAYRWPVLRVLMYLPFVVSSVLLGLGLLLLYPQGSARLECLLAGYVLLAYPFVAKAVVTGLDRIPGHWVAAARLLGARPWRVWWRVLLPLLWPSIRHGAAFATATAVGEFAVTLFLARPEWLTLTTLAYQHLGRPGQAHFQAALLLALALLVLSLLVFRLIEGPPSAQVHHA